MEIKCISLWITTYLFCMAAQLCLPTIKSLGYHFSSQTIYILVQLCFFNDCWTQLSTFLLNNKLLKFYTVWRRERRGWMRLRPLSHWSGALLAQCGCPAVSPWFSCGLPVLCHRLLLCPLVLVHICKGRKPESVLATHKPEKQWKKKCFYVT